MPTIADRLRRLLPSGLTGLAGGACAACSCGQGDERERQVVRLRSDV